MANKKINELTGVAGAAISGSTNSLFVVSYLNTGNSTYSTRKMTAAELLNFVNALRASDTLTDANITDTLNGTVTSNIQKYPTNLRIKTAIDWLKANAQTISGKWDFDGGVALDFNATASNKLVVAVDENGDVVSIAFGNAANTVAQGNDGRFPTTDEKDALAGTGTPSSSNVYVTDDDVRLDQATDTQLGVVEKATQAEVDTGTDTDRYLTPSTFAGSSQLAGKADVGHSHSDATTGASGFMSATDKTKLDGIESGATADQSAAEVSATDTNSLGSTTVQGQLNALGSIVSSQRINLTSGEVGSLNTTAQTLVAAPGADLAIVPKSLVFELQYGTATYDTNTTLQLQIGGNTYDLSTTILASGGDKIELEPLQVMELQKNTAVELTVKTGDPQTGDSSLSVFIEYETLNLS